MNSSAEESQLPEAWERRLRLYEAVRGNIFVASGVLYGAHEALRNSKGGDSVFGTTLSVWIYGVLYGGIAQLMEKVLPMGDLMWVMPALVTVHIGVGVRQFWTQK